MGDIPAKSNMISSIITFPKNGDTVQQNQDFTISVQTKNLQAGSFTNADATYYAAPQQLNGQGQVIGHTHVTVQDLGNSLNPSQPPDPTQFAFFKGINDAGNGQGLLSADVALVFPNPIGSSALPIRTTPTSHPLPPNDRLLTQDHSGGLPAGNFRVCTLTSSSNHQAVIMPVAQRGSQDDCTKFTVVANGNGNNNGGQNQAQNQAQNQKQSQGQNASAQSGGKRQNKRSRLEHVARREFIS